MYLGRVDGAGGEGWGEGVDGVGHWSAEGGDWDD